MGNQGKPYALVSMTNKDVYYVTVEVAKDIQRKLTVQHDYDTPFIHTTDVKSGAEVVLNVNHVSSVVIQEGKRYA